MRIFNFKKIKFDKKYLLACLIAVILAIISSIVLYIFSGISIYTYNFADTYIYYVLNFSNVRLFFSHFAVDLFYIFSFFLIGCFTKHKYLTCPILFLKWFFAITYVIILFTCFSIEGIIVALVVFIPSFLISSLFCLYACDCGRCLKRKYALLFVLLMAVISTLLTLLLINVIFRILIVIV